MVQLFKVQRFLCPPMLSFQMGSDQSWSKPFAAQHLSPVNTEKPAGIWWWLAQKTFGKVGWVSRAVKNTWPCTFQNLCQRERRSLTGLNSKGSYKEPIKTKKEPASRSVREMWTFARLGRDVGVKTTAAKTGFVTANSCSSASWAASPNDTVENLQPTRDVTIWVC